MSEVQVRPLSNVAELLGETEAQLYAAMTRLRDARELLVAGDAQQKLLSLHVAGLHRDLEQELFNLRQLRLRVLNGGGGR